MTREDKSTGITVKRVHLAPVYFKPAEISCLKVSQSRVFTVQNCVQH